MAGSLRRGRCLIFGLVLAVGAAAFACVSYAKPLPGGAGTAQAAPRAVPAPAHSHPATRAARTAVVTPETEAAPAAEHQDTRAEAIARVQRCFAKLGYYKGPIDGKANEETWTAHWYFKNDHGLKAYGDFLAEPVQRKLDELCKEKPVTEAAQAKEPEKPVEPEKKPAKLEKPTELEPTEKPAPAADAKADAGTATAVLAPAAPPEPVVEEEAPVPLTHLEIDCLPEDLIGVLRHAHGDSVSARACHPGCLPPPKGLGQAQLDDLQNHYGVVWCRSCVQIQGHLSLDDVRRIEREGHFELCSVPPRQLPRPGSGNGNVVKSFTRIRELYRALPSAAEDSSAIAVIIGNSTYENLPPAETARSDAGAMYAFLTEHLGYRQDRIIDVRDARKVDLERVFGPVPGSDGELARLVRAQPDAKVVVYYSGHGATNSSHSETYLLPVDAEPYREEQGGYPLSTLYANLAALKAKSVLVLLESEYGRDHGNFVLPPNLPETTKSVLPAQPLSTVTVLSATDHGQRGLLDTTYDIGLFTRYVIEGLAGSADLYPVGNGDGMVDSAEIYAYTAAMVRLSARKTFGLLQEPVYSSVATPVLAVAAKTN